MVFSCIWRIINILMRLNKKSMKSKRIAKILGIGLSAGLVFALLGAVFVAPAAADQMKWTTTNTPDVDDLVILPESNILDYDIGGDGDIIYAALEVDASCNGVGEDLTTMFTRDFALVKSDDGGVTWTDITANVIDAANLPTAGFEQLVAVAVAPDDEEWLAVAGYTDDGGMGFGAPMVVASQDGGDNFSYTGDITDGVSLLWVFDLAVSIEVDSIHNIAIAGIDDNDDQALFRLKAGTWLSAAWEDTTDATDYLGWDDFPGDWGAVVGIALSPNFELDDTIVAHCFSGNPDVAYIQSGIWEGSGGSWNDDAAFPGATEIKADGDTLTVWLYKRCMGLALPEDYDGSDPGARAVFIYVNAFNETITLYGGCVFRVDNNALSPVCGPPGDPVLASIDVHGDADTGKLMIGEYVQYDNDNDEFVRADCCASIRVWHTEELDFCCPQWDGACKNPSGPYMALVMYTPDGEKEYATSSGLIDQEYFDGVADWASYSSGTIDPTNPWYGSPGDESAFSVSRDDAVSFNQIGLIDTDIDFLSDFVACPDCGTYYLATINANGPGNTYDPCEAPFGSYPYCYCDSIWRSYDEGDTWERINHGDWANWSDFMPMYNLIYLRLPCDAIEDCCDQDPVSPSGTIYMGIRYTNDMFYSRDCGQCWNKTPATKITIEDFTVESENIVYVVDVDGYVSKSTQYGRRWSDKVDTDIGSGTDILACCEQGLVVVGGAGGGTKIAWSDGSGDSWNLTDKLPADNSEWTPTLPVPRTARTSSTWPQKILTSPRQDISMVPSTA